MAKGVGLVSRLMEGLGLADSDGGLPRALLHRPLRATRFVSLDLETTGLDYRRDAIVSVALVEIANLVPVDRPILHTLIDPGRDIPPSASAVHGITDDMVRTAPAIAEVLPGIVARCADAVVVGHHVGFDVAMLRRAARAGGHSMPPLPWLCTWRMTGALDSRLAHRDLADIAQRFGIAPEAYKRHDALDDARLTAHLFARLADRYADLGHATLGAVEALARRWQVAR
jgi:DNA polymerase-3 subunit epsilon